MTMLLIILAGLLIGASIIYALMKKNVIKDEDNNGIPDSIDEKIAEVKETVKVAKKKLNALKKKWLTLLKQQMRLLNKLKMLLVRLKVNQEKVENLNKNN